MKTIRLSNGEECLVDDEDFDMLSSINWFPKVAERSSTYATCNTNKKYGLAKSSMHRVVMKAEKGQYVDHINGNGLDNRKENLRLCTNSENLRNRNKRNKKDSSKYKGVSKMVPKGPNHSKLWRSYINLNGKQYFLGNYYSEEEARQAYDNAVVLHHGKFAKKN